MRVWQAIGLSVVVGTVVPVWAHHQEHGVWSAYQIALAFFLWLNVLIALWEICLFLRIDVVRERHERLQLTHRGRALARSVDFMRSRLTFAEVLSPSFWTGIWTSYAGFDETYTSLSSFGFCVDVGNGFTTLVPSLLFIYAMTFGGIAARALGIIGIVLFYQMFYGTVVYLGSFVLNKRYVGHPPHHLALIVGCLNGLWLTFPLLGIYVSIRLVYAGSYDIFLH